MGFQMPSKEYFDLKLDEIVSKIILKYDRSKLIVEKNKSKLDTQKNMVAQFHVKLESLIVS